MKQNHSNKTCISLLQFKLLFQYKDMTRGIIVNPLQRVKHAALQQPQEYLQANSTWTH